MNKKIVKLIVLIVGIIIIFFGTILIINFIRNQKNVVVVPPKPVIKLAWSFPVDSVNIDTFRVERNQCLSDILTDQGISLTTIDKLARNANGKFDVRRVKSGNYYYLISKKNSSKPYCFIYEENVSDYYLFYLNDSCLVQKGVKNITTTRRTMSGVITSSLWNSFTDRGTNPNLCIALSDIFAWTVDFFGVQKGDRYKVIYDEYSVDGKFAGIGKIYTAMFECSGETIPAYFFENGGQSGYFDDKGNSLRRAFLKAPLNFSRISSHFSSGRFHPILKILRPHFGVDYAAPTGTPVYSIGDGQVIQKAHQIAGGGNYLTIRHNSVYTSQYMHLSKYAPGISSGSRVKQGQLIGFVGMTGLATGPHLDFRMYMNGSPVDPLKVKTPPVEPICDANKALFITTKDSLLKLLDAVPFPSENLFRK